MYSDLGNACCGECDVTDNLDEAVEQSAYADAFADFLETMSTGLLPMRESFYAAVGKLVEANDDEYRSVLDTMTDRVFDLSMDLAEASDTILELEARLAKAHELLGSVALDNYIGDDETTVEDDEHDCLFDCVECDGSCE